MKTNSHMNFEPCTTYKVSIEVKSYEMIYCTEPLITERKFTTNDRGKGLYFIKIIFLSFLTQQNSSHVKS